MDGQAIWAYRGPTRMETRFMQLPIALGFILSRSRRDEP
jgi:hypothetical protein